MNYSKQWMKSVLSFLFCLSMSSSGMAQEVASLKIDANTIYQRITGFGGFVCNPQFQYGHMSDADIKKVWEIGRGTRLNSSHL